jgi:glycosyltransferase involved in cell wall biosynthesis
VLIVSPHFPPINAPDHQRVRMSLPYLRENGWEAHVLAVDPRHVEGFRDPDLVCTVPDWVPVTRVGVVSPRLTRWLGFGSLGLRSRGALDRAGGRLLRWGGFDLVYFSTTVFSAMGLGPRWKRRFGVPYVIDLQDPWVSDYYDRTGVRPPGGWWKYRLSQWLARRAEPPAVRGAAHIISVSPAYPQDLQARYRGLPADRFTVLPFGAPEADADLVRRSGLGHTIFDPADGCRHWVYLGRGGADMARPLRGLFLALQALRQSRPEGLRLRLHFVGTSYASGPRAERTVEPIARECGVADLVSEQTGRVPYLEGLALLQSSDAVLLVGSDDAGYSPSKVFPCILAGRPLLAVVHEASLAGEVVRRCRAGQAVSFGPGQTPAELARAILPALVRLLDGNPEPTATDWAAFEPYTARNMTRRQCAVFDRAARKDEA